jgi:hypothetical protein
MTPERWREIEELYHAAREHGRSVLARAEPELRREVERLLEQESGGRILDRCATELLDSSELNLAGRTISHLHGSSSGLEPAVWASFGKPVTPGSVAWSH